MDHYGSFNSQTDFDHRFDLNNDGKINLSDFFIFSAGKQFLIHEMRLI